MQSGLGATPTPTPTPTPTVKLALTARETVHAIAFAVASVCADDRVNGCGGPTHTLPLPLLLTEDGGCLGPHFALWSADEANDGESVFARVAFLLAVLKQRLDLDAATLVSALVLWERAVHCGIPATGRTLRPLLVTAVYLASKQHEDEVLLAKDVYERLPELVVDSLFEMELAFCRVVSWKAMVWPSTWKQYAAGLASLSAECGDTIRTWATRYRVDDAYVLAGI